MLVSPACSCLRPISRSIIWPMDERIRQDHRLAEAAAIERLRAAQPDCEASHRMTEQALSLARGVRSPRPGARSAESFLRHYGLATPEGVALMCVAEALLRTPDPETADALLREKLSAGAWGKSGEIGRAH